MMSRARRLEPVRQPLSTPRMAAIAKPCPARSRLMPMSFGNSSRSSQPASATSLGDGIITGLMNLNSALTKPNTIHSSSAPPREA